MRDIDPLDVLRAAKKVQSAWRGYRKRNPPAKKRKTMGRGRKVYTGVKNTSWARQAGIPTGPATGLNMGVQYITDFPWPFMSTQNNSMLRRETNVIHCKGIRLCRTFQYAQDKGGANDIGDIEVHYAIVQLKNDEDNTELEAELWKNWFRDNSSGTSMSTDFPTYTSGSVWNMKLNCQAINPNNKVNVLMHKKKQLHPVGFQDAGGTKNYWQIDQYLKIGKNFSFKDNDMGLPSKRLIEVYWYNTVMPRSFPANPAAVSYIETDVSNTVYYGSPDKCCRRY